MNFFCIYTLLVFCLMLLNYRCLISVVSHETGGISFRNIALSAQMTDSLNKSLCGSLEKHKAPQTACRRILIGPFDYSSSVPSVERHSLGSARVIADRRQISVNKLLNQLVVYHQSDGNLQALTGLDVWTTHESASASLHRTHQLNISWRGHIQHTANPAHTGTSIYSLSLTTRWSVS